MGIHSTPYPYSISQYQKCVHTFACLTWHTLLTRIKWLTSKHHNNTEHHRCQSADCTSHHTNTFKGMKGYKPCLKCQYSRKSTYILLEGMLYSHQYRWHLGLFQEFHDNINSTKLLRYRQMPTPLITQQYYIGSLMKALSTAPKILSFTGASAWYQGVLCIEVLWNGWEVTKFHFKIFFPSTMNSLPVD